MSHSFQLDRIERKLDALTVLVRALIVGEQLMSMNLSELEAQVAAITTAEGAAVVLIMQIAGMLQQAQGDQAKIDGLAAKLQAAATDLAAAVVANTPAAPAPPTV